MISPNLSPLSYGSSSTNPNFYALCYNFGIASNYSNQSAVVLPTAGTWSSGDLSSYKLIRLNVISSGWTTLGLGQCSSSGGSLSTGAWGSSSYQSQSFPYSFISFINDTFSFGWDLSSLSSSSNYYVYIPYTSVNETPAYHSLNWGDAVFSSSSDSSKGSTCYLGARLISNLPDPTSDDPSGGSSSDYSGIISAITLIPATIIVVCLFKMIFNVFMNRKVRG